MHAKRNVCPLLTALLMLALLTSPAVRVVMAAPETAILQRPLNPPTRVINPTDPLHTRGISVYPTGNPMDLLDCLIGPDVTISDVNLIAASGAAGTFSGGLDIIGFDQGLVLSSGCATNLPGPNMYDNATCDNSYPGDPDLNALIPGYATYDAAILEFDFECEGVTEVSFQYVFASEEYNEYVNTDFNDVFGFFLNGVNIAIVPGGCSDPGIPVAINNINCGNPYVGYGLNCNCYRNNDLTDGGGAINTEMDGLTQVFYASATIQPGVNHIKLAIADAGDRVLDSVVLIRCQSFTCGTPPTTGACCFPNGECVTLSYNDCFGQGGNYYGDGMPCVPNPCDQPVGACCFADGSCQVVGEPGCLDNNGVYFGDWTQCDPSPCPPAGACCLSTGECIILIEAACADAGGSYKGDGVPCDPDPCGPAYGACCFRNALCRILEQERCILLRGTFMGRGAPCDPNPCITGKHMGDGDGLEEQETWGRIKDRFSRN